MFSVRGAPALSQFRLDQLLRLLQAETPRVTALFSRWVHFVDAVSPLGEPDLEVLGKLLTYGTRERTAPQQPSTHRILVTPRVGTVSPWSSKATDIVRVCGLEAITRVERGTLYDLLCEVPLDAAQLQALAARLHDRMTESVWIDRDEPDGLFHQGAARPLRRVALAEDGTPP